MTPMTKYGLQIVLATAIIGSGAAVLFAVVYKIADKFWAW